jgi:hypothetical protein
VSNKIGNPQVTLKIIFGLWILILLWILGRCRFEVGSWDKEIWNYVNWWDYNSYHVDFLKVKGICKREENTFSLIPLE